MLSDLNIGFASETISCERVGNYELIYGRERLMYGREM
jgi:hypothetical protein